MIASTGPLNGLTRLSELKEVTSLIGAPIIPRQSTGATDGAFLRAAGIPVYGVGGGWSIVGDERILY